MERKTIIPENLLELIISYSNNDRDFQKLSMTFNTSKGIKTENHLLQNVKKRFIQLEELISKPVIPHLLFEDFNLFYKIISFYIKGEKITEAELAEVKKIKGPVIHIDSNKEYKAWTEFEIILIEIKNMITPLNYNADTDDYLRVIRIMIQNIIDHTYEYRAYYLNNI